jgi:heme exporter protein D
MSGLTQYFAMGGYAAFIWPSYGLALILLVGMVVAAFLRMRAAETAIEAAEQAAAQKAPPQPERADRGA